MLGLRTSKGLPSSFLEEFCGKDSVRRALDEGNLQILDNGMLRIPEERFFISDAIIADFPCFLENIVD